MTENQQPPDLQDIPEALVEPKKRRTLQLVWVIPIIAALVGLSLAVNAYLERGPVITITFKSGEGLEAGKTKISYKGVQIGLVKGVAIAADRSHVIATAELSRAAEPLLVSDTRFWVVRARISGGNVSGLNTLMGGSYIGVDAGTSKERKLDFQGLETPPAVAMDLPGRQYVLHAADIGSLDIGSPIFYRRIQVGEVTGYQLDKAGTGVTLTVFVRSPYNEFVKENTLFWHASGFDLTLDATGVKVSTESMLSVLMGGISFRTPEDTAGIPPAPPNTAFTLFATQDEALKRPDTVVETYVMVFKESVRGLAVGAPVDLRGVTVGEVTRISVDLDTKRKEFTMPVEVRIYPDRLATRNRNRQPQKSPHETMKSVVENGLRAQLRSGNLLTGQMYIALDFFPKAPPARVDLSKAPPEFPTIPGSMEQLQATLLHIAEKIEKFPLEELGGDARQAMKSLDSTLKSAESMIRQVDSSVVPEARAALADIRKTLDEVRGTIGGARETLSADAPLQQDLRETLRELSRAAQSLRSFADYLDRHPEALIRGKKEDRK